MQNYFLTPLPVSHAIQNVLPHAVCFAMSCPANHAICSYIDSSGYASGARTFLWEFSYNIIFEF